MVHYFMSGTDVSILPHQECQLEMALKFLNKKGWHTGSLRNLENVWKAEQKHEAEQKKLEELKVQIHKEREAEELRQQYQAAGLVPKQDRLEFLYDSGAGPSVIIGGSKPADDYSSQRASTEAKTDSKPEKPGEKIAAQTPGALFSTENNNVSANDKWRKIHSDPLYLIKQQELAALERIRKNPVKMEMLANEVRQKMKAGKDKDEGEDGRHKKRKKDKSSKKRDRDHKEERSSREKKRSKSDKHRKSRDRDDSIASGSSEPETEARPAKRTDDGFGRRIDRDSVQPGKFDRETAPAKGNDIDERRPRRSHRDLSPSGNRDEDSRDRGGSLVDRSARENGADRVRENSGRDTRSEHYDRDGDRRSRRNETDTRSLREIERSHQSSKDSGRDARGRVTPDYDDRRSRYNGSARYQKTRYDERDTRDSRVYEKERDSRHYKEIERDDRRKRTGD
ncbi:hypothetical protein R1sor_005079 [Riccia sorocarpa]|uniref:CBF1-interacting co-repressor CIR N-terminal domain-containing protein n=1 Tax=Riccia sorocarpa TaxID=122646 RepID=A0ABD3HIH8_9MARC